MVKTDNKVALRQLELANAALLSTTALRSYPGKSLAKDGKFHPRVFTLVGAVRPRVEDGAADRVGRAATTQSLFLCYEV